MKFLASLFLVTLSFSAFAQTVSQTSSLPPITCHFTYYGTPTAGWSGPSKLPDVSLSSDETGKTGGVTLPDSSAGLDYSIQRARNDKGDWVSTVTLTPSGGGRLYDKNVNGRCTKIGHEVIQPSSAGGVTDDSAQPKSLDICAVGEDPNKQEDNRFGLEVKCTPTHNPQRDVERRAEQGRSAAPPGPPSGRGNNSGTGI
jgi:hypothetical protein